MRPKDLKTLIKMSIQAKLPILIKGSPGIGKSDIVAQACDELGVDLIISHPVVSDPTDYKGLPFPSKDGTHADFLPFGDLLKLINAEKDTVFFLDDLGQAPASVQASVMQLLLARKINGKRVADCVSFIAATNRREDKAGVMGILEPVKSRFAAIVELKVHDEDWIEWAYSNDMPPELIAFIKFRPDLLNQFKASNDIVNTPCPRTVAYVGKMLKVGLSPDIRHEAIAGAVGEGFAAEFLAYCRIHLEIPPLDVFVNTPMEAPIYLQGERKVNITGGHFTIDLQYAVCSMLIVNAKKSNIDKMGIYIDRLPPEYQARIMQAIAKKDNGNLCHTDYFIKWCVKNEGLIS